MEPILKELHVKGMHCKSCEVLIENKLRDIDGIKEVKADLSSNRVKFRTDADDSNLINEINSIIEEHGYSVHSQELKRAINYKELGYSFVVALGIAFLFVLIQLAGVTNLISAGNITYPVVFLIGIVASISTCMAVVGGLVLSISSTYAKSNERRVPLSLFHISRLLSFFVLGGVLGYVGSFLTLTPFFYFTVTTVLFVVMVILAVNLLDIFPVFQKLQVTLPKQLTSGILKTDRVKNFFTPAFLGLSTFFLPCGFTQSMQINAIASGNVLTGALTMSIFALGTLPVLALISFGSTKLAKSAKSGLFFKTSGFLVLFFALYTFLTSLVSVGIIAPIF